ncbi:MAG: DUF58 domain-containing protein [Spirochaetales bacterium]
MPTPRGWTLILFSSLLLVVGVVRDELGVVIWGGGMLFVVAVVVLLALIGRARLRAVRASFSAQLDRAIAEVGDSVRVHASIPAVVLFPGFVLEHRIRLSWGTTRTLVADEPVRPGGEARWEIECRERGDFRGGGSTLAMRDVLGLTASGVREDRDLRVLVVPAAPAESPDLPVRRGGERAAERSHHRVRSEELREVRPYVPGDDVRRLSWKHLAAYDELLVRIGEYVPPARGDVLCRIDEYVPPRVAPLAAADALMAALRAVVRTASARGVRLSCAFPARRDHVELREDEFTGSTFGSSTVVRQDAAARPSAGAAAVAGFVPAAEPERTPRRPAVRELVITARDDATGPWCVSVAPLLERLGPGDPLRRRLFFRSPP